MSRFGYVAAVMHREGLSRYERVVVVAVDQIGFLRAVTTISRVFRLK